MKRFRPALLFIILLISLACFAPATLAADYYEDEESGVRFEIPEGWEESTRNPITLDTKVVYEQDEHYICYGTTDLWAKLSISEKKGYTRSDIDNSYSSDSFLPLGGNKMTKTLGNVQYHVWRGTFIGGDAKGIIAIYIQNGYLFEFAYVAERLDGQVTDIFYGMLESVEYQQTEPEETAAPMAAAVQAAVTPANSSLAAAQETYTAPRPPSSYTPSSYSSSLPTAGGIILSLILTVAIYSLPIIIYRYGIRKRPMEKKPAKRLTIIYAICAFVVMLLILFALGSDGTVGGAIILWSFINYHMLTRGEDRTAAGERNRVSGTYTVAGQPDATSSGWYPADGPANPYASAPPYNSAPDSGSWQVSQGDMERQGTTNPYADTSQPYESAPNSGARPEMRSDLEQPETGGAGSAQQSAAEPPVRQDKDKYDHGDNRKRLRGDEPGRSRGHEPHKYWRGE